MGRLLRDMCGEMFSLGLLTLDLQKKCLPFTCCNYIPAEYRGSDGGEILARPKPAGQDYLNHAVL